MYDHVSVKHPKKNTGKHYHMVCARSFFHIFSFFFIVSLLFSGCGLIDNKAPSAQPVKNIELAPDPNLITGQLENGFRYVLMKNTEPKNRVSIHLNVQVGSMHEEDHEQGLAHYLEHMLFNSLEHFEKDELIKYFQSIGMMFGADANAHTGFYETVYDMLLPDGSEKHLRDSLTVMDDFARGALLIPSEIDKERKIILAEKRTRDSASYRTFVSSLQFSLPDTKLAKRLPIGIEETIKNADQETLKGFYDAWYRPENLILVAVGDFDPDLLKGLIEEKFISLPPRSPERKAPKFGDINHKGVKTFYHYEDEEGSTSVTIEIVKKIKFQKDSYKLQKKLFTDNLANMMVQNRLSRILSTPEAPFTTANIGSGIYLHHIDYAEISATCDPGNWENTLNTIEQTLRQCTVHGFLPSEFERVKKDMAAMLENAVKGTSTRDSSKLARQIIMSLNEDRVFQSPEQEQALYTQMLEELTIEDVHEAFKELWPEEPRLVLVTGNAFLSPTEAKPELQILSAYETSLGVPVAAYIEENDIKFPYLSMPPDAGEIIDRKDIQDLGMTMIDFKNGVRLNLKKTDFKADEVIFYVSFGYGRSDEPKNLPGLYVLAQETLNESGFGQMNKDQLQRALSGKSTAYMFSVSDENFAFKGSTIKEEITLLFELLYTQIEDFTLRDSAFALAQNRLKQEYEALSRSIEGGIVLFGESFIAGGDNRFGLPPYEKISNYALSDIRNWIAPSIKNDTLEVSIVGDFDMEEVIEAASTTLGALPERKSPNYHRDLLPLEFPMGQKLDVDVKTEVPKGIIVVSYPTDEFWHISRTRRLSALGAVFTERMRVNIREKLGAAYSAFAYNKPSQVYPNFGVFQAVVQVDPNQADVVINAVKDISEDIVVNGITEEELRRAIDPIITTIKDMQRTNGYWLNSVFVNSMRHMQQLNWSRTIRDDYQSISVRDINNLAKIYLKNEDAAVIRIYPKSL